MSLPITSKPRGPDCPDVATSHWAGITVRVAWALLSMGVRLRPPVLRDARDHVMLHLAPSTEPHRAEDQADTLTTAFVRRARREINRDRWPQDASMPLSPRWRRTLDGALDPAALAVLRLHYGDGRPIHVVTEALGIDELAAEGARAGLREVLRTTAAADGLPSTQWPDERLDAVLRRLAAMSSGTCPPLQELVGGGHAAHRTRCAPCDRTVRLLKAGVLTYEDLIPPMLGGRPQDSTIAVALHFHPEARHHRSAVGKLASMKKFPVGEDLLLLDGSDPDAVAELLHSCARVGTPHRDHLRGVTVRGEGRWSRHGLVGPLTDTAIGEIRAKAWGHIDGIDPLPHPRPAPPSARRWWFGVAGLAAVCAATLVMATGSDTPDHSALDAEFTTGRGGAWVEFDVADASHVAVVREVGGVVEIVLRGDTLADKARIATGDGRYRMHAVGTGLLVAATGAPLAHLSDLVAASDSDTPLDDLATRLRTAAPDAEVAIYRPKVGS